MKKEGRLMGLIKALFPLFQKTNNDWIIELIILMILIFWLIFLFFLESL
jgi:hypothetical protein